MKFRFLYDEVYENLNDDYNHHQVIDQSCIFHDYEDQRDKVWAEVINDENKGSIGRMEGKGDNRKNDDMKKMRKRNDARDKRGGKIKWRICKE